MTASELISKLAEEIAKHGDRDLVFEIVSSVGDSYGMTLEDVAEGNYRHRGDTVLAFAATESLRYFDDEEADE